MHRNSLVCLCRLNGGISVKLSNSSIYCPIWKMPFSSATAHCGNWSLVYVNIDITFYTSACYHSHYRISMLTCWTASMVDSFTCKRFILRLQLKPMALQLRATDKVGWWTVLHNHKRTHCCLGLWEYYNKTWLRF